MGHVIRHRGMRITFNDSVGAKFVEEFQSACVRAAQQEKHWVSHLRKLGVQAALRNDGWIDRERHTFVVQYPYFVDSLYLGGIVALGWPEQPYRTIFIQVTGRQESWFVKERWQYRPLKLYEIARLGQTS